MGLFRIRAKFFAVTYPRCPYKNELVDELLKKYDDIHYIAAASEQHEDGTPHTHILIEFKEKKELRDERCFDFLLQHPNIQGCRNPKAWFEYISKEGTNLTSPIKPY